MDPGTLGRPAWTPLTTNRRAPSFRTTEALPRIQQAQGGYWGVIGTSFTPLSPLNASDRHGGADLVVGVGAALTGGGDATGFQDVVAARCGEGEADVLLDQ